MRLLPLEKLGPRIDDATGRVRFGFFLPNIGEQQCRMSVMIKHEHDQLRDTIPWHEVELEHSTDPLYGDYWSGELEIPALPKPVAGSAWGAHGRYVYRFVLRTLGENPREIPWIIDPFAREFGIGRLSAFTYPFLGYDWGGDPSEADFKVPHVQDLVIYEMMINEFGGSVQGGIERLDYLAELGINCIEVMPLSNVTETIDWGYLPNGYFGLDERFGKRWHIQEFVHEAHKRGIAVIFDMVFGHTSASFPYSHIYQELEFAENPFMGDFGEMDAFGSSTQWDRPFVQDYFFTVAYFWLDRFHADGFRFDCVPNFYNGFMGSGYANLVHALYQKLKQLGPVGHWQRLFNRDEPRLIQCAEHLSLPGEMVQKTYSNCAWQDTTMHAARALATEGRPDQVRAFGEALSAHAYLPAGSETTLHGDDRLAKALLQYIETHDHERFICSLGMHMDHAYLLRAGDREQWPRLQPYLIALLCARGAPLLWQGQELVENYFVPNQGMGRVRLFRPLHWEYYYDTPGSEIRKLIRTLLRIRRGNVELRRGTFELRPEQTDAPSVLMFTRRFDNRVTLVTVNFSNTDQDVYLKFPLDGDYVERLHGFPEDELTGVRAVAKLRYRLPSNYGRIWSRVTP
jgi:maltooligosyltrehalose trehalohydrolase